jgi:hypothetical protein
VTLTTKELFLKALASHKFNGSGTMSGRRLVNAIQFARASSLTRSLLNMAHVELLLFLTK